MIHHSPAIRLSAIAIVCSMMLCVLPGADAHDEKAPLGIHPMHLRTAHRMQGRVERFLGVRYESEALAEALHQRSHLLHRNVSVNFAGEASNLEPWNVSVSAHTDWLVFVAGEKPAFMLDDRKVRQYVADNMNDVIPVAKPASIIAIHDGWVPRAELTNTPVGGYAIDTLDTGTRLAEALMNNHTEITVDAAYEKPTMYQVNNDQIKELTLLASGKSDFGGSPGGRRRNVEKAFLDHVQSVVVKPGEKFSFNKVMDSPISGDLSWSPAMVIMNGTDLVSEPGGGICQAATTVYRAALLAGLPILKRANHSLYVTYYKAYGVGIDATYYPDKQDLLFENDTGSDIVFVTRIEGDEAYVDIYGVPDGRTVELEGPFFAKNNPTDFTVGQRKLAINEIGWKQKVIKADGTTNESIITSRYVALPRTLHQEYRENRGTAELLGTYVTTGTGFVTMR